MNCGILLFSAAILSLALAEGNEQKLSYVTGEKVTLRCPQLQDGASNFIIKLMFSSPTKLFQNVHTVVFEENNSNEFPTEKYKQRIQFRTKNNRHYFVLLNIQPEDGGVFICRIMPKIGSTISLSSSLSVVEPPTSVLVTDSTGREAAGIAGPYNEMTKLELTCEAFGGKPPPNITWYLNDKRIVNNTRNTGKAKSILTIEPLLKSHTQGLYRCEASNHKHQSKKSKPLRLNIYTMPTNLEYLTEEKPLIAGQTYEIECLVRGSKPPAEFSWTLDYRPLSNFHSYDMDENITEAISTLEYTPKESDEGKELRCYANNPSFKQKPIQVSRILSIHYPPNVTLSFHPSNSVDEGHLVRLDCKIKSNPSSVIVSFYKKSEHLRNVDNYLEIKNRSMTIVKTNRKSPDTYTCGAKNEIGEGYSNPAMLHVNRIPQCKSRHNKVGASRHETVNVTCAVDAWPAVTRFYWQFNRSRDISNLNKIHTSDDFSSVIKYTPKNEKDFGSFLCWAENSKGKMAEPCIYDIIKAELPDRLENCSLVNRTYETIFVACISGKDGGLEQKFVAKLFDTSQGMHVHNISSEDPEFFMDKLSSDTNYYVTLYSWNSKGHSEEVLLKVNTTSRADPTGLAIPTLHSFPLTPVLSVLIGVVGVLVVVALITAGIMHLRRDSDPEKTKKTSNRQESLQSVESGKGGSDRSGIPNKLKTPNLYVAASRDQSKEQKGQKPDSSDVEYTELKFTSSKKTSKKEDKKKKKKSSGKIKKSEEDTLYASIDYAKTGRGGKQVGDEKSGEIGENGKSTANIPLPPKEQVATKCGVPKVTPKMEPTSPKSILSKKNDKPAIPDKPSNLKAPPKTMVTKEMQTSDDEDVVNKERVPLMQKTLESNL